MFVKNETSKIAMQLKKHTIDWHMITFARNVRASQSEDVDATVWLHCQSLVQAFPFVATCPHFRLSGYTPAAILCCNPPGWGLEFSEATVMAGWSLAICAWAHRPCYKQHWILLKIK